MFLDILKGFVIGICASAPVGPIAILVIQKSITKGHKAGFITGMGACVVDTVFSIIAIFALAAAQRLIDDNRELILIAGGLVVALLGWSMSTSNPLRKMKAEQNTSPAANVKNFLQAVVMGLSNPGAILVIFALFAFFGIGPLDRSDYRVAPIILSVSCGAAFYWFVVTWLLSRFQNRFNLRTVIWINRLTGAVVIIIGLVLLGEGLFRAIFKGAPVM